MLVLLDVLVADEGSVVVFSGTGEDGRPIVVAVDRRMAQDISDELLRREMAPVPAMVETWQILGHGLPT